MIYAGIFLFIYVVFSGFILIEEELLIMMASVSWVYAASGLIKNVLLTELVHKGTIIKKKYMWFLKKKVLFHDVVLRSYYVRIYRFFRAQRETAEHLMPQLIENNIDYYVSNNILLKKFDINLKLYLIGISVIKEVYIEEMNILLNVLLENKMYVNKYTTVQYVTKNIGNFNSTVNLVI